MKVAFQGSLGFGGLGTVTRELTKHLAEFADVTIYDVLRSYLVGLSLSEVDRIGISQGGISTKIPVNLPFQALAFRRYDLVHINYAAYGVPALISNEFAGLPFVQTVHGIPQPELESGYDKIGYMAEQWAIRLTARKASLVVADSGYIHHELKERFSIESKTIPLGVDTRRFAPPTPEEKVVARQRLKMPQTDKIVLYAGRLTTWKDPLTLIEAASIVLRERHDVAFYLVGRGPLENEAINLTKVLGINDRVFIATSPDYFHGLADYYKAADVFVLPTRKEGFGLVVLEAMACGLCVVASDGGAPPELLGGSGLLFETRNPESLAKMILRAISDDKLRGKLGLEARARASQMFTWEKCAHAYQQIYASMSPFSAS